jgi:hypothetical protein
MAELTDERKTDGAPPAPTRPETDDETAARHWARTQVERKHKLRADAVAYLVINAFLIGAWMATGFGYFWPGWVLAGWGVLLLLDAWNVYYRRPVTDAEIEQELRNRR